MAGMSFTSGSKRRWASFAGAPRRGTSLRPGGSAYGGGESVEGPRTDGWETYAQGAQQAANEAMANRAASMDGAQQVDTANNPYLPPEDEPIKLDGGTMGLKPDLTEYNRLMKEEGARLEKESSGLGAFMGGFAGIPQMRQLRRQAAMQRIEMARQKAYDDAMAAKADLEASMPERYEPVKDAVLPGGQMLERGARSGEVRPAYVKTQQEDIDWPDFMGAAPTKVTTEVPRMSDRFEEAYLKDRMGIAEEGRKATQKQKELDAATAAGLKEISARGAEERKTVTHRGEVEKGVSTHQAGLPARERGVTPRAASYKDALEIAEKLAGGQYKWEEMTEEERRKRADEVYAGMGGSAAPEDLGRDPAQGRRIAAPATGAKRGLKVGDVVDGYEYTNATGDGNGKNPKNWKQVGRGR